MLPTHPIPLQTLSYRGGLTLLRLSKPQRGASQRDQDTWNEHWDCRQIYLYQVHRLTFVIDFVQEEVELARWIWGVLHVTLFKPTRSKQTSFLRVSQPSFLAIHHNTCQSRTYSKATCNTAPEPNCTPQIAVMASGQTALAGAPRRGITGEDIKKVLEVTCLPSSLYKFPSFQHPSLGLC